MDDWGERERVINANEIRRCEPVTNSGIKICRTLYFDAVLVFRGQRIVGKVMLELKDHLSERVSDCTDVHVLPVTDRDRRRGIMK